MIVPRQSRDSAPKTVRPFINLPTPPPEFDLPQWLASVDRIDREQFRAIFLTHFGKIENPQRHLAAVRQSLEAHTAFISDRLNAKPTEMEQTVFESAIFDEYRKWVRETAHQAEIPTNLVDRFITDTLLRMNVTGIVRYLTMTTS